jgi:hypothetical protein
LAVVAGRICTVSYVGLSGIRHCVDVEAESLYEAAVLALRRFREDIWGEAIGTGLALDVEVKAPGNKYSVTVQQVERWLAAPSQSPYETSKKARLKMMLVQG